MKRTVTSPTPKVGARQAPEVYCRRDNRVYPSCPHAGGGLACPCLHGVETADGLFEPKSVEDEPPH
jgi:hypothetical protein